MVFQSGLWRHTQTGYLTTNNGISYDTVGADALHTIHLRNLPLSESVYDGGGWVTHTGVRGMCAAFGG